jgi:hypothetical protein
LEVSGFWFLVAVSGCGFDTVWSVVIGGFGATHTLSAWPEKGEEVPNTCVDRYDALLFDTKCFVAVGCAVWNVKCTRPHAKGQLTQVSNPGKRTPALNNVTFFQWRKG